MVERESAQASPVFSQQAMNPWEIMKLNFQSNVVEQEQIANSTSVKQEAESLCNTFLNVDFEEMTNTLFRPESQNPNYSKEKELTLMSEQNTDFGLSNENDYYNIIPEQFSSINDQYLELGSPVSLWGCPMDLDALKMDDVFQVDKADLVQSPTLAELNANDESLFDSFDNFELGLFSESRMLTNTKSQTSQTGSISSPVILSDLQSNQPDFHMSSNKLSQIKAVVSDENLGKPNNTKIKCDNIKEESDCIDAIEVQYKSSPHDAKLQTVPSISLDLIAKQISSSVHTVVKPIKVESQQSDFSESDIKEINGPKNIIQFIQQSNEDAYDSDEDSDMDFFNSSDAESMDEQAKTSVSSSVLLEKKRSRFFWQYNIQSKGPKGPRLKLAGSYNSVKNFPNVGDPIFSSYQMEGVKHAGKARRGDGNDLTPNPRKLYSIGIELQKLNSIIDDLIPVNELPFNIRTKSRKEKNKLASRACRLKKKAQHEANKLKLFGLQHEQKVLLSSICHVKKLFKEVLKDEIKLDKDISEKVRLSISKNAFTKVAGHSADFVNHVLERVAAGDPTGGLNIVKSHEN